MKLLSKNSFFLCFIHLLIIPAAYSAPMPDNLIIAARGGNFAKVKALTQKNKDNITLLNNALGAAIMGDQEKIVNYLIEQGAEINHISSFETSLLINTIMNGRTQYSKLLLEKGADPNARGYDHTRGGFHIHWDWTALMCAARIGDVELVKLLLKKGADTKAVGWSLIETELESSADIAAYSGNLDALKYLIKKKVPLHEHTIFKVVRGGHKDVLAYLLPFMKDINNPGPFNGRTLLIEAAWWGHADIVQFLIDKGADINATDTHGYTAVSEATDKLIDDPEKQLKILEVLVKNGADLNLASHTNIRPYDRAAKYGNEAIRLYLKENGAEPTLFDN